MNLFRICVILTEICSLSLFLEMKQLSLHLSLMRLMTMTLHGRTDQMSHTIYLSSAWVKLRGANPQIEQRANRNSSTHLFSFFSPQSVRKPDKISTLNRKIRFALIRSNILKSFLKQQSRLPIQS